MDAEGAFAKRPPCKSGYGKADAAANNDELEMDRRNAQDDLSITMNIDAIKTLWKEVVCSNLFKLVILTALLLGLTTAWLHRKDGMDKILLDAKEYHRIAVTLLQCGQFTSTYRAPLYPIFVAGIYAVFGISPYAVFIVQSFLFAASVMFVGLSFLHITNDRRISLLASIFMAAFPLYYMRGIGKLMTEILSMFLVTGFIWLLLMTIKSPKPYKGAIIGLIFALGVLTKAVLLPFAIFVPVCLVTSKFRKKATQCAVVFVVSVILFMTPWTIRNYYATGAILPVSTGSGFNFWIGNYPGTYDARINKDNSLNEWPYYPISIENAVKEMTEVERDHYLQTVAVGYIKEDPMRALGIFCHKFSDLWLGNIGANLNYWGRSYDNKPLFLIGEFAITDKCLVMIPMFIMALMGVFCLDKTRLLLSMPILLLLFVWTGMYVYIVTSVRYLMPVEPYATGFAAIAVTNIWDRLRKR